MLGWPKANFNNCFDYCVNYAQKGPMSETELNELSAARDRLLGSGTILIAANTQDGSPEMGVTPFVRYEGAFYIYPSHLASHVRAMLDRGTAQFMVIEDEATAQNIWARHRLKFTARIDDVPRDQDLFNALCRRFRASHGPTIDVIRDFSDFHMLRLRPVKGVMILGFAKAFELRGPTLEIVAHLKKS